MAANKKKTGKPTTFTFYDGFSESVEMLPDFYSRACFVYDIQQYGAWGVEPDFRWVNDDATRMAVEMAWRIALPSIQKSVQNHKNSNKPPKPGSRKRGRPRKADKPKADDTITVATDLNVDISGETLTQAAWAAEQLYEPIPDDVVAMIEPVLEEVEVF